MMNTIQHYELVSVCRWHPTNKQESEWGDGEATIGKKSRLKDGYDKPTTHHGAEIFQHVRKNGKEQ